MDFLVATDAIGMGLNMDVDHVAFARLSKFDGNRPRRLLAPELAQIAGRAGRGMRDGTFGTTADSPPLDDFLAHAIEEHEFEPLEQLCWRNSTLDFTSIETLQASLAAPPPGPGLVRGNDATDMETLAALARDSAIRDLAQGRRRVRMLWDACQIPDFRKLADDTHAKLCARIFGHIAQGGKIPTDWLAGQIAALARADGDIDTLMQRLSGVRVWTYIAARADWVPDAEHWQGRARAVEDILSDALHERLTTRFVDKRATHLLRRLEAGVGDDLFSAVTRRGEVVVEGHPVGHIEGFGFLPDPLSEGEGRKLVMRAARRALQEEMPRRVARVQAASDSEFALLSSLRIAWDGAPIARLRPGAGMLRPMVEIRDSEFLDGVLRERLRLRLQAFIDAHLRGLLGRLFAASAAADHDPSIRGALHRLVEGLGVATGAETSPDLRGRLKALGVQAGRHALFMPALLKPQPAALRAALWALARGSPVPTLPPAGAVAYAPPADWPEGFAAAMGWIDVGPTLLRLDVAERLTAELAWSARRGPTPVPPGLASRLSVRTEMLPAVLRRLGFRLFPAAVLSEGEYGPPAPAMMLPERRRKPEPDTAPALREGPFAALAALRHR